MVLNSTVKLSRYWYPWVQYTSIGMPLGSKSIFGMIGVIDEQKKNLEGERECCVNNMGKGDKEAEEEEEKEEELTDLPEELSVLIGHRVFSVA